MTFADNGPRIWPITPDWNDRVTETLRWGTDVMHASANAVSQHVSYEDGPLRGLSFSVKVGRHGERQLADALLAGHRGRWLLPIWHDLQRPAGPIESGDTFISCTTEGFDFVAGGKALLYGAPNRWEIVDVDSIEPSGLGLVDALANDWPRGTRLYPLRWAREQPGSEENFFSDAFSDRQIGFTLDEPSDWPVLADPTLYLTHPVLTQRPDESEGLTQSYKRILQGVQYTGCRPFSYDLADQALRVQSTPFTLRKRARHSWFRSLLYTLDGRSTPMWLPSFASDLRPAAAIAGGSTSLSVQWAGYTQLGKDRHNRKDVRIELAGGAILYRRIANAVEAGDTETLTLSSSLDGASIAPERIRSISFLALATLASDNVEIEHVTDQDGTARCTLGWQAVVPDV